MTKTLGVFLAAALAASLAGPARAADKYPSKPIKLIVTARAGGGEDTEARMIAPFVEKRLGVSITIEDQPGAGGKIAFEKFVRDAPDGYTLITYTFPKSVIIEYQGPTHYKTSDFTPIFAWSHSSQLLVVNGESWKTFEEFLKAAKAKTLAGGLSGRGSTTHLMGLIALDQLGIKVNWVPYEGSAGSVAALAGKHLDFTICLATSAVSLIQAGKLRPLLLFSDKHDPYMPDVPIPSELGYKMTFVPTLRGVEAPPHTPAAIVAVLEKAFREAAADPGFVALAKKRKMVLTSVSSKELGQAVADAYPQIAKFKDMLKR